jgi:hypothetical protein
MSEAIPPFLYIPSRRGTWGSLPSLQETASGPYAELQYTHTHTSYLFKTRLLNITFPSITGSNFQDEILRLIFGRRYSTRTKIINTKPQFKTFQITSSWVPTMAPPFFILLKCYTHCSSAPHACTRRPLDRPWQIVPRNPFKSEAAQLSFVTFTVMGLVANNCYVIAC